MDTLPRLVQSKPFKFISFAVFFILGTFGAYMLLQLAKNDIPDKGDMAHYLELSVVGCVSFIFFMLMAVKLEKKLKANKEQ